MHEQSQFKDHARLAQKGGRSTPEPVIIRSSHTGGNLFCCCKTFDAKIDYISNFVLIVKKLDCANRTHWRIQEGHPVGPFHWIKFRKICMLLPLKDRHPIPTENSRSVHGLLTNILMISVERYESMATQKNFFLLKTLILNFGSVCFHLVPKYRILPPII